jgi:hypothetical protein
MTLGSLSHRLVRRWRSMSTPAGMNMNMYMNSVSVSKHEHGSGCARVRVWGVGVGGGGGGGGGRGGGDDALAHGIARGSLSHRLVRRWRSMSTPAGITGKGPVSADMNLGVALICQQMHSLLATHLNPLLAEQITQ